MKTEQMDTGVNITSHLLQYVPPTVIFVSAVVLNLAETLGAIDPLSIVEKYGGAGFAGIIAYLLIRWLLNDKQKKDEKIEQMHNERIELYKEMLREVKDERSKNK